MTRCAPRDSGPDSDSLDCHRPSATVEAVAGEATLLDVYCAAVRSLLDAGVTSSVTDALVLVQAVWPGRALADPRPLPAEPVERLLELVRARVAGQPVAYLTGRVRFMGREFRVTPDVLVPRDRTTETLVRLAVLEVRARLSAGTNRTVRIADIGVGSGNVLLSVLGDVGSRGVYGIGVERSASGLAVARSNADRLGVVAAGIGWLRGDLASSLLGPVDVLTANLPYVARPSRRLRFEPSLALQGRDSDGLGLYRHLVADAPRVLDDGGVLCYEVPPSRANAGLELARPFFDSVSLGCDASGVPRAVVARRPSAPERSGHPCR